MFSRSRYDDHLSRKFFHLTSGSVVAYLFVSTLSRTQSMLLMAVIGSAFLIVDLLRLKVPALNRLCLRFFRPLMREDEDHKPSAQLYYVIGMGWAIFALPKPIAIHAILCLAWMDPIAAIYGLRFGQNSWSKVFEKLFPNSTTGLPAQVAQKTLEGSFAGFAAAFFAGVVAWTGPWAATIVEGNAQWISPLSIFALAVIGGLASVIAEVWPSQWDDNASIPFWVGLCVWALASILGIPLSYL